MEREMLLPLVKSTSGLEQGISRRTKDAACQEKSEQPQQKSSDPGRNAFFCKVVVHFVLWQRKE